MQSSWIYFQVAIVVYIMSQLLEEALKSINKLSANESLELDGIHKAVLKELKGEIGELLAIVFNLLLQMTFVPEMFRFKKYRHHKHKITADLISASGKDHLKMLIVLFNWIWEMEST